MSHLQTELKTLRPRNSRLHFPEDNFKCIVWNEYEWIPIKISLTLFPKGPMHNIPALVLIMARRRPGDKPLSEPMLARLLTHICVTQPQWFKCDLQATLCFSSYVIVAAVSLSIVSR